MTARAAALLVGAALLMTAGCGGGGGGDGLTRAPARASTPTPAGGGGGRSATPGGGGRVPPARSGPVTRSEIAVIRGWADTLRHGDVEGATSYWATPASAADGGPPVELATRAAVRSFNASLPCGARLESTQRVARGLVLAVFRLTERPGPGSCGTGTGDLAATVFRIRGGKIDEWVRAAVPAAPSSGPGGSTT